MFTGIVQGIFPIVKLEKLEGLTRMTLALEGLTENLERGASVSVSGACLTATEIEPPHVTFDIMAETLRLTTLGSFEEGDVVNVERSMKFGDEVGGHISSGHVSGVGEIVRIEEPENNKAVTIRVEEGLLPYVFEKGFVTLDGASLTIVGLQREEQTFSVWLIPETLERTTFGTKGVGAKINVEVDPQTVAIVETVERILQERNIGT